MYNAMLRVLLKFYHTGELANLTTIYISILNQQFLLYIQQLFKRLLNVRGHSMSNQSLKTSPDPNFD